MSLSTKLGQKDGRLLVKRNEPPPPVPNISYSHDEGRGKGAMRTQISSPRSLDGLPGFRQVRHLIRQSNGGNGSTGKTRDTRSAGASLRWSGHWTGVAELGVRRPVGRAGERGRREWLTRMDG